jgi:hypothetical protein
MIWWELLVMNKLGRYYIIGSLLFIPVITGKVFFFGDHESSQVLRCPSSASDDKVVLGNSETIFLGHEKELIFDAKIDSGAEVSSMHAIDIHVFSKPDKHKHEILYVRFKAIDDKGKEKQLEKLVSRVDQVKSASGVSTRYFFKEKVYFHEQFYETEINLADRSAMSKKFLIGRNLLDQGYLIDTSKSYILTKSID